MKLIAYGKTNWEKEFPSALKDQVEAKKYVSTFHSALSPLLRELVDGDKHIMSMFTPGNSATTTWHLLEASGDPHGSHHHEAARLGE